MKRGLLIIFLIFQVVLFSQDNKTLPTSKKLVSGRLKNGMEYFILKNKKPENRATLNLVVKAGSLFETDEQQGLAHFLEHMAFNGTKKYKKNDMIKYLQSIGLSFGGDLNAYTSFSETVYKLQIPTDKKNLNTGFEVLKEWAENITLDKEEIESEKKIVLEEWRLRQGIAQRLGDIQRKILFSNSRYQDRFPIGLPKTIQGANYNLLKDFYTKWYQPQNMAIIAVGDFDVKNVKNIIEKEFSHLKNKTNLKKIDYKIPLPTKNSIEIFTDTEITSTAFNIMWKDKTEPVNNKARLKEALIEQLFFSIINTRYSILAKESKTPYRYSSFYSFKLDKDTKVYAISSQTKDKELERTIENVLEEFKYLELNGVLESELEKEKLEFLNNLKTTINNKESISNNSYVDEILTMLLEGDSFVDIEEQYGLVEKAFKEIDVKSLKLFAQQILKLKYDIFITAQERMKKSLPNKSRIETIVSKVLNEKKIEKSGKDYNTKLKRLNIKSGKIEKVLDKKEYKEYLLSNGIKVYYKKTDFKKDSIGFKLYRYQGNSKMEYSDYVNTLFLPQLLINSGVGEIDYKSLPFYLKGKVFSVAPFISDYIQGFVINTNEKDLEEGLNYFRTLIEKPRFEESILKTMLETNRETIINRESSPQFQFGKLYTTTLNNNKRRTPLELKDLDLVSKKMIEKEYETLFSNFYNYNLIVVGNIDENRLKPILERYFASLPVKKEDIGYKPLDISYPKGNIKKQVVKGIDKKSSVIMTFPYKNNYSQKNRALYNAFSSVLDILLIEEIREKIGGVYSISSIAKLDYMNFKENYLQIRFSTEPKRTEEVIKKIKEVIIKIQKGEFSKEKIKDIQNNYRLSLETALKTNGFWSTLLERKMLFKNYNIYTPEQYNKIVNFKNVVEFANKSLNIDNCIEVVLLPEKEE